MSIFTEVINNRIKKKLIFLNVILFLIIGCNSSQSEMHNYPKDVPEIVREANIVYDSTAFQTGHPYVPQLVSNGIVGACFDHMGFQSTPTRDYPQGRTVFGYIRHYEMDETSRQIQFPLAAIQAEFADGTSINRMFASKNYQQKLDIYSGILNTSYNLFGETDITAFAHQTIPNLFIMKIDRKCNSPDKKIVLNIECETSKYQNNRFNWPVNPVQCYFQVEKDRALITSKTNLTTTNWIVHAGEENEIITEDNKVKIKLNDTENIIRILVLRDDCPGVEILDKSYVELKKEHQDKWHQSWQKSWIDFPADRAQKIWSRMKYYAISHFPVILEKPLIPTGLNSNIWGFTFPQDVYYVEENVSRLGHYDRAQKALQYWLDILPQVKDYTERIMDTKGAFYPWTPPFEDWEKYEKDGVVSPDSYELHNPAYVLAMVWHYYKYFGDQTFLQKYFPVIQEVWRFYSNISIKNEDGRYDVYHEHARGQDEASTTDGNLWNLLCASYSAEYSCRKFLEAAKLVSRVDQQLLVRANSIMEAGYERETLMTDKGYYKTYERDDRPPNSQKHPVQLNPIAFLPMPDLVSQGSPVEIAYENRYDLTCKANKPKTRGWTFGEFFLASVRMGRPDQALKDLSAIQICRGADPRWIQFYESSFWPGWHMNKAYYFPMHGLFMQGFTDMLVQDWRGYVDLFACLFESWKAESFAFEGIRSLGGVKVSGRWDNGKINIRLKPGESDKIDIKISAECGQINAKGQKSGPKTFRSGEKVSLIFDSDKEIILNN